MGSHDQPGKESPAAGAGLSRVVPYLCVRGGLDAVAFYETAFGAERGVLYSLRLERPGGLEISGLALAAVKDEMLDLLLLVAPSAHYFEHRRDETHALFASVRRPATGPERDAKR
jgi:hypothetical protein